MALSPQQIEELNAAALKPNKTAIDIANLDYAAKTFNYQAPTSSSEVQSAGGLTQLQIEELNAAALKPNKTATDIANLDYAAKTFGYQAPVGASEIQTPEQKTQASVDSEYAAAIENNPAIAELMQGGSSVTDIINALSTGDLTGIVDWQGQPFSTQDQQEALTKGMEDNKLFYEAQQTKDTADEEANLAQKSSDYQDYLINAGQQFEADKTKSDQSAADRGVLFSGSRVQKEKNLQRAYSQDQASNRNRYSNSIGNTARDFQYKYGNEAAGGLSKYYNLGQNTYNPNVATGGVGQGNLSSIYNPSDYNFQGTKNTERSANANTRAAGYLWNKGNKLLATGYKNQY